MCAYTCSIHQHKRSFQFVEEVGGSLDRALLQKTGTFGISWIWTQRGMERTAGAGLLPALRKDDSHTSAEDWKSPFWEPKHPQKERSEGVDAGVFQTKGACWAHCGVKPCSEAHLLCMQSWHSAAQFPLPQKNRWRRSTRHLGKVSNRKDQARTK